MMPFEEYQSEPLPASRVGMNQTTKKPASLSMFEKQCITILLLACLQLSCTAEDKKSALERKRSKEGERRDGEREEMRRDGVWKKSNLVLFAEISASRLLTQTVNFFAGNALAAN